MTQHDEPNHTSQGAERDSIEATKAGPRTGLILGFLIGGSILIGVSLFSQRMRGIEDAPVPAREILTRDTIMGNPVRLLFRTAAPLELTQMGWMADGMHLHVIVDSVEIMPGPADIVPLAGDTFAWTLPPVTPGSYRLRMFWSDERHAPIGDTTAAPLTVH